MRSPYEFYLHDVLKLRDVPELAVELEATTFGDLLHRILDQFAQGSFAASTDESEILAELDRIAKEVAAIDLGTNPPTAVAVQLEQAMYRLKGFAKWQAERMRQGWRIVATEWVATGGVLKSESGDLRIRGRIDRIDYHEEKKQIALLDYKTGEGDGANFKRMYQENSASVFGPWNDLQLPLYRMLAQPIADEKGASITMGYVWIPKRARSNSLKAPGRRGSLIAGLSRQSTSPGACCGASGTRPATRFRMKARWRRSLAFRSFFPRPKRKEVTNDGQLSRHSRLCRNGQDVRLDDGVARSFSRGRGSVERLCSDVYTDGRGRDSRPHPAQAVLGRAGWQGS
jgi:hypothetical protein